MIKQRYNRKTQRSVITVTTSDGRFIDSFEVPKGNGIRYCRRWPNGRYGQRLLNAQIKCKEEEIRISKVYFIRMGYEKDEAWSTVFMSRASLSRWRDLQAHDDDIRWAAYEDPEIIGTHTWVSNVFANERVALPMDEIGNPLLRY